MKQFLGLILYFVVVFVTQASDVNSDTVNNVLRGELEDAVVVGNKQRGLEITPSQQLKGKALQNLNAHSVADAIRYFSGVQIKDYGGVGGVKTIDVRGMGSNHVGVFYDGVELGNAQNGQVDLGKFSLDNMESITLYNGQRSALLQSAKEFSSAGSVYLRTATPIFSGDKLFNIEARMRTGSFGLANPSVRAEFKLSRNVCLTAGAEYTYATGKYKFRYRKFFSDGSLAWDTTALRQNGDIHALRVEAGVFGVLQRGKWNAKVYYYDSERGIPGAIVNNVWKNSQRQWDRNFFVQGGINYKFDCFNGRIYEFQVSGKYARDYMHYLNPDTVLMYTDNKFRQDELYLSFANRLTLLPCWDVSLSVDWQWNKLNSTLTDFLYPQRNMMLVALATSWLPQGKSGKWRFQASLLESFIWDKINPLNQASHHKKNHKITPSLVASWSPMEYPQLTLLAFYKKIFRMPTFNDLYYTDIGNANLEPEYATQYNLGGRYSLWFEQGLLQNLQFGADAYFNFVDNKIVAVPKGNSQYRWMMLNIGKVRITGLDFRASLSLLLPGKVNLQGQLNYTYQRAKDYSDPSDNTDFAGTYKGQIAYIPMHSGSAILQAAWRGIGVNYSFIYVGERWHNSSNIPANYEQPWYTHDLAVSYSFHIAGGETKVSFELNNLFNQQYEVIQNYPMPGRNWRVILSFKI